MLRAHPIAFPLSLIVVGGAILAVTAVGVSSSIGQEFTRIAAIGILVFAIGILMLPFGVVMAVRRTRHRVPLVCPACGLRAEQSRVPFEVERPGDLDYAVVTCPKCSWVFQADKYATFV
jgi:hypothetical protein